MANLAINPLTIEAQTYTLKQLAFRTNWNRAENLPVFYGRSDQFNTNAPNITIVPASPRAWQNLLDSPSQNLHWLSAAQVMPSGLPLPVGTSIPVLFWGAGYEDGHKPFAEQLPDGSIIFYADIIAATFFMLSRWEETVVKERDIHGRFPATASVAYKQGVLDRPIVDEYALILRAWLRMLLPGWEPKLRPFTVQLTHDIDLLHRFPNIYTVTRTLGGDLLKRRSPQQAKQTLIDAIKQIAAPDQTLYVKGIYSLAELSRRYGFDNDAFYFMADGPGPFGCGYDPVSPIVRRCIDDLRKKGFEIGFHPGYDTFLDPERLAAEKSRMDAVLGETQYGGRQHYLRFQSPDTWRHWEEVGLTYDSTVGYADYEGFRCGTCHPFHPFDVAQDRELNLLEIPLIVMDGTLKHYRNLTLQQGQDRILTLAQRCKQVEGTFTLLWHNSSLDGEWGEWFDMYECILKRLSLMVGYL